jgi:ABC-type phosphate transport system permease subunit
MKYTYFKLSEPSFKKNSFKMLITIVVVTTFIAIPLAIFLAKRKKNNYEEISNLVIQNNNNS